MTFGPYPGGDLDIDQILDRVYRRPAARAQSSEAYAVGGVDIVDVEVETQPRWSPSRRRRLVAPEPVTLEAEGVRLVALEPEWGDPRPAGQLDQIEDFFPRQNVQPRYQPGRSPLADLAALRASAGVIGAQLVSLGRRGVRFGLARLRPALSAGLCTTAAVAKRGHGALTRAAARVRAAAPGLARRLAAMWRRHPQG